MNEHRHTLKAFQFEELVSQILTEQGFEINRPNGRQESFKMDFLGRFENYEWAIEVKYYRTERPQVGLLKSACKQLIHHLPRELGYHGILVTSNATSNKLRTAIEAEFGVSVIDRNILISAAQKSPTLLEKLFSILEVSPSLDISNAGEFPSLNQSLAPKIFPEIRNPGKDLCERLKELPRGKKSWPQYEKLCEEILLYLFPNDLTGWHSQKRTDDGLNRYDYVCRVLGTTDFWAFVTQHLDSRYVLFEFKNYSAKIQQGQILTTEKYLLEKGLRKFAIIFSRKGEAGGACATRQGAMREHGKLMLVLDDEKICKMLHMRDEGNDPSDLLYEEVDNFLLSLPR